MFTLLFFGEDIRSCSHCFYIEMEIFGPLLMNRSRQCLLYQQGEYIILKVTSFISSNAIYFNERRGEGRVLVLPSAFA
jgi:hypothetical protein